jgi:hypothetical protein
MQYQCPGPADLENVFVLNRAFIAWQRSMSRKQAPESGPGPGIPARLDALDGAQRERLARTPFLLMSLAEDDELRWQSLFNEQRTRDLLQCMQPRDEAASKIIAAGLGFLWQLSQRNAYAARLVSGASMDWCEQLSACTLMDLIARALEDQALLAPRMADRRDLWDRLLTAGVSTRRQVRLAARAATLQAVLIQSPSRPFRPLAAAACKTPPARARGSRRPGE